ncbi:hypothetical protein ACFX2I_025083 [Malus domestica]
MLTSWQLSCCSGLSLLPWACCDSCQALSLMLVDHWLDLGLLTRVLWVAALRGQRWWNLGCGLVAFSWLLGHKGGGDAAPRR